MNNTKVEVIKDFGMVLIDGHDFSFKKGEQFNLVASFVGKDKEAYYVIHKKHTAPIAVYACYFEFVETMK